MNNDELVKDAVRQQFGKNAEKYVASESHAKGDDLTLMLEWLQPQKNWKVLDIATGGGHVTKQLSPYVSLVCATDLTVDMLSTAQKHLTPSCENVMYVVADAENLPFLANTFDLVTCRIAAHHFPNPQLFVKEASRVLKPGGKLLLIDNIVPEDERTATFVNQIEKLRDTSHVCCYSINQWLNFAHEAGIASQQSRIRKKTFDFPSWVRRTADTDEQVESVCSHLLGADEDLQQYCGLVTEGDNILSIQIDEWMTLFEKE
ncbi:methyltransferase domain-containing protein [Paenibacillus sp. GSMTC-2017]|uniref:class I SAM-dependent methyltransferase n=1 Tax=Paenibacillus sp. GSMTC-2017 TaxID=2794350 RepID=UPI0018D941BE|nr:class I SAM-dependent methyltransferase [Paenibacillus sp. GSMTC-2017]MBH5316982.1 methyltransferase domain-containing protein [Paenibacillus sp. GSMTC-2017]